ncbi:hypothetical protein RYX36_020849 [Vicia faba]
MKSLSIFTLPPPLCQNGEGNDDGQDEDIDPYSGLFEDEQKKILEIKELLEDPRHSEDSLLELLQNLVDIDITFQEMKFVNVAFVMSRKWKEIVDEWVKLNPQEGKTHVMGNLVETLLCRKPPQMGIIIRKLNEEASFLDNKTCYINYSSMWSTNINCVKFIIDQNMICKGNSSRLLFYISLIQTIVERNGIMYANFDLCKAPK